MSGRAELKPSPSVFISHAAGDREFARTLAAELTRAGLRPWSMNDVLPGSNVYMEIGRALEASDALIVLLSPEAAQSQNLTFEVGYALSAERFAHRVIPVMVRPTSEMPWILERFSIIPAVVGVKRIARQVVERLASPVGA